ncbi:MAG: hypothetical protein J6I76_02610 [Oribacterium sp.]|nr:hypothetical protein [Oribacterium sp.]MBP3802781.1 hypothetical protein [Oribacterium sp.]
MEESNPFMPGDLPDWIQEAERAVANGVIKMPEPAKEVTIKFGKGLVGEPFISKSGHEFVEVKIPNQDPEDKTPWASFVISPKMIHENKFGKGVWMKLQEDGTTRISKPFVKGIREDGKKEWDKEVKTVANIELKGLMEAYKTKDRDSLLEDLEDKKKESAIQPVKTKPENAKAVSKEAEI